MLNLITPIEETRAYQSILEEDIVKGEAKGEARGEARGMAKTLKRQLAHRFGALPSWAEQRIDAAPITQLEAWIDEIFDARSLESLLGPMSSPH